MKKQQIAAAACLVAGAIGFAAVYSTQKPGKDEIPTEISQTSSIVEPTEKKTPQKTTEKVDSETKMGQEESAAGQQENQQPTEKQLHFVPENVTNWPVKGDVLLPFSMDKTVYFPTLDQYQYNRGMVIRANEGDAVCSVTEGRIIDIYDSAETGCTVVQDLGDGYTATYGQLANLTCSEGDVLESHGTAGPCLPCSTAGRRCRAGPTLRFQTMSRRCLPLPLWREASPGSTCGASLAMS